MIDYCPPKWRYDYGRTGRGYNLKMLSIDEIIVSAELLKAWLSPSKIPQKLEWYKPFVKTPDYESHWIYCLRVIGAISKTEPNNISSHEMNALNDELNRVFSDEGWRQMKQKFSQQAKRQRKVRPEISSTLLGKLHAFKSQHGLSSIDETIDELLSFHADHHNSSEVGDE